MQLAKSTVTGQLQSTETPPVTPLDSREDDSVASLFLVGNTNRFTFANAALAAHVRDRDLGGSGLSDVFVLHSPESEKLLAQSDDWKAHLNTHGLDTSVFVSCMVDLQNHRDAQLSRVARHVERFLKSLDRRSDVYVDLTNGNSLYKSVLSNIAFVLGVRRQFVVNTTLRNDFLQPQDARQAYTELPDPAALDSVAPAWLTEVRRFNLHVRSATQALRALSPSPQLNSAGFEADVSAAINAWFEGVKRNDGATLGGAVRHVGRAFEDLMRALFDAVSASPGGKPKTLYDMLARINAQMSQVAPEGDPRLFYDINELLRRIRNACTHGQVSPEFGRIHARLSTELLLASAEYVRLYHAKGLLAGSKSSGAVLDQCAIDGSPGLTYYFGVDGDDTGLRLERFLQGGGDHEALTRFSASIEGAIQSMAKSVQQSPLNGEVLFAVGDDLLFRGTYDRDAVADLKNMYSRLADGVTCSVGFGKTMKEAYVALKMAKAAPGKDAIVGIELVTGK
jgi:hypothetical protein